MGEEARQLREDEEQWRISNKAAIDDIQTQVNRYRVYGDRPGVEKDVVLDALFKCVEVYKGGPMDPLKELMKETSK